MEMCVKEVAQACGGTLLSGEGQTVVTSVETDSREIRPGGLFVPIVGQNTDAHDFIEQTFAKGAVAALTQRHTVGGSGKHCLIAVENTQAALQKIAASYRNRFTVPVVGVTGSVGKTSAREMIALGLSAEKNVMRTKGNSNSQIGLPLTMFQFEKAHTAAVIEMGISEFGEMERLVKVARPTHAVITNIGIAHIEQLKTKAHIMSEKLKITQSFGAKSALFLNGDDKMLAAAEHTGGFPVVYYGTHSGSQYRAERIQTDGPQTVFTVHTPKQTATVTLPVVGAHNVSNALAAIAVADAMGLNLHKVIAKLADYQAPQMRQTVHRVKGITVIDDSYNASPDSVKSGVEVLCSIRNRGKKIAVLADMLELGSFSEQAHFETGVAVANTAVDALITVGERAKKIAEGARSVRENMQVQLCESNGEAIQALKNILQNGDAMLVKGSRGMKTDEIVKAFL